ncbi:MAG: SPOR domain-containing protein [Xanthomonadales bacterium]|nr:SPOR domain-containing protein [Xanthomonadales bacterium]
MDPMLQKRLIGASVLILLAIIFVPMLLDGSDQAGSDTLPLIIPEPPERDFETRVIPLDTAADTAPAGVAEAIGVAPDEPAPIVDSGAKPANPDALATVDTQAPTRVDAVSGDAVSAVATPASAPVATEAKAPELAPVAPTPVAPTPVASTAAPAATAASGRFLVGLGSYSNTANANALATQLRAAGYAVLTDTLALNGQNATRLRIGPYATRGQAEAARLAVKQLRADLPAAISEVDDTPAADAPATARSAATAQVWAVQIGAFKVETEANTKRDQLRQAGFAAFVEKINAEAGLLWRVRIGPENQRADADAVKAGVKRRFGIDGIVVPYP